MPPVEAELDDDEELDAVELVSPDDALDEVELPPPLAPAPLVSLQSHSP